MRTALPFSVLLTFVLAAASSCAKDTKDASSIPPDQEGGDAVQVRGTEQLAWSQMASSSDELRSLRFVAFVDDVLTPLADAQCGGTRAADGYGCTARLPRMAPGRHVIELATIAGASGLQSARSLPLVVNVMAGMLAAPPVSSVAGQAVRATAAPSCIASRGNACLDVDVLTRGLGFPQSLAPLPDGRLLFVEGSDRIALLSGGAVSEAYRHEVRPLDTSRLIGLAVDPWFSETRFVYLALLSEVRSQRTLSIVRLREVGGVLAQAATIVPDLPIAPSGLPALSMGPDRHLYVALPAPGQAAWGRDPYAGQMLRFTADGAAAGDAASPIFAPGSSRSSVLAWLGSSLWMGASGEPLSSAFSVFPALSAHGTGQVTMKNVLLSGPPTPVDDGVVGLVFDSGMTDSASTLYALAGSPGALYVASVTESPGTTITSIERLVLDELEPMALAVGPDGELFVAASKRSDPGATSREYILLRFAPGSIGR